MAPKTMAESAEGTTTDEAIALRSIYVAAKAPALRAEIGPQFGSILPPGWVIAEELRGATVILTVDVDVTEDMIRTAGPSLRAIGRVERPAATVAPTDLPVFELPRVSRMAVAEHTVLMILALTLQLLPIAAKTASREWVAGRDTPTLTDQQQYTFNWIGHEPLGLLYGKVVGIIGLGSIGSAVAERLRPFGVRLLYSQRYRLPVDEEDRLGVEWRSFDQLLQASDVITLHHRFQEGPGGNEGQFGPRELALMRPTAYLINTSRGRLIDEEALAKALREEQIAGAALDVFCYEPLPAGNALFEFAGDNAILTPHVAGGSSSVWWRAIAQALFAQLGEGRVESM